MKARIGLDWKGEDTGIPHQDVNLVASKSDLVNEDLVHFPKVDGVYDVDAASIYVEGLRLARIPVIPRVRLRGGDSCDFAPRDLRIHFDDPPIPEPGPVVDIPGGTLEGPHMTPKPTECPHCGHIVFPGVLHLCEGEVR